MVIETIGNSFFHKLQVYKHIVLSIVTFSSCSKVEQLTAVVLYLSLPLSSSLSFHCASLNAAQEGFPSVALICFRLLLLYLLVLLLVLVVVLMFLSACVALWLSSGPEQSSSRSAITGVHTTHNINTRTHTQARIVPRIWKREKNEIIKNKKTIKSFNCGRA